MYVCMCVLLESDGQVYLDWVKIGFVSPDNDSFSFSYINGWDEESVWEGQW